MENFDPKNMASLKEIEKNNEPPKMDKETHMLQALNVFLEQQDEYEKLLKSKLKTKEQEDYEKKSKELRWMKGELIKLSSILKETILPKLKLGPDGIYTHKQIKEEKRKIEIEMRDRANKDIFEKKIHLN